MSYPASVPEPIGSRPLRWSRFSHGSGIVPGLALAVLIAAAATAIGRLTPIVGPPVLALLIGVATAALLRRRRTTGSVPEAGTATFAITHGAQFVGRYVLQATIVALGAGLPLDRVLHVGARSLPVLLGTCAACLAMTLLAGRLLRVDGTLRTLIGAGTGICGTSAVVAVTAVIGATDAAVTYAITSIVAYNITSALVFPVLGHLLGLGPHAYGMWAGTAVNDTSSVVAAGYAYGPQAGDEAVVVKLTRILLIVPLVGILALRTARRQSTRVRVTRLVPPFLVLFLAAAACRTGGLISAAAGRSLTTAAAFGVTMALAGIGLTTRLDQVRDAGLRPLALAGVLSAPMTVSSLALQALLGPLNR